MRINSDLEARASRVSGAPSERAVYGLPVSLGPRTSTGKNRGSRVARGSQVRRLVALPRVGSWSRQEVLGIRRP